APRQPSRPTLPDALPLSRAQPAPTTHQEPTATTTHQPQWTIIPDDGSRSKRDTLLLVSCIGVLGFFMWWLLWVLVVVGECCGVGFRFWERGLLCGCRWRWMCWICRRR